MCTSRQLHRESYSQSSRGKADRRADGQTESLRYNNYLNNSNSNNNNNQSVLGKMYLDDWKDTAEGEGGGVGGKVGLVCQKATAEKDSVIRRWHLPITLYKHLFLIIYYTYNVYIYILY